MTMKSQLCLTASLAVCAATFGAKAATLTVTSLADDGSAGTLRALAASASAGDEIVFDDSLAGGTIAITTASGPIKLPVSLSIVGPADAPVTIDGLGGAGGQSAYNGGSRTTNLLFAPDADSTITLKNLVFTGSKANQDSKTPEIGPAVSIVGAAVIDNCLWTNNGLAQTSGYDTAGKTSDGGACLRVAGNLTLSNSRFVDNGVNGSNYSMGGTLSVRGETIQISNCVFSGAYGWGGATVGGNVRAGGTVGVGPDCKSFTMTDCLVEKAVAGAGGAGVAISQSCSGAVFRFRNCAFRDLWGIWGKWVRGGAIGYDGNNANTLIVENTEFSHVRFDSWGGAVRWIGSNGRVVFANCTFFNCLGSEWGGATDTRCATFFVNCTAAGNVNSANQAQGSGTFFVIDRIHALLNTAAVWNYNQNGALRDDTSRFGSTLAVYNSFNHSAGNGANAGEPMDYDESTKFFTEPFDSIDKIDAWKGSHTLANSISVPVLTVDEKGEKKDPALRRVVDILPKSSDGVLDRAGWPVKHSADWSDIAYSSDGGATWTALVGDVANASEFLTSDSRGVSYSMRGDIPLPPIGSATAHKAVPTSIFIF